jgi:hypothetical protein
MSEIRYAADVHLKLLIGDLVIKVALLSAENEDLRAKIAAPPPPPREDRDVV